MKQQFSNVLSLVDSKAVKSVLNSSQWLEESKRHNNDFKIARFVIDRLEKGIFTEVAVKERLDQAKTSSEFDDYYNSLHPYNEGEVIDLSDLIDNVNYWFAQFIAGDMAASLIPSEYSHVLETYTFFIK
jgi:hypothetical protein